jgi:DNA-directed RNA polymerase specialized sigma24 family protein
MAGWALTLEAFDTLRAALDADRQRAGEKYVLLRSKLVTFFERRGGRAPEDQADETLNRVAKRIGEGLTVLPGEVHSYAYGVARNVLREDWQGRHPDESVDDLPLARQPSHDPWRDEDVSREVRLECLNKCLQRLEAGDRELIAHYHSGQKRARIDNRRLLSKRLGIPINALRIRAYRIRRELEGCVRRCLERAGG